MMISNPYSGSDFFSFIKTFFLRLIPLLKKESSLASDELQVIILSLVAASAAIVGVFMIYRKMTMLANALSHSVLFGIALTYILLRSSFQIHGSSFSFQQMFLAALITGFLTAFLSQLVSYLSKLQKDASIGLVFTTLFAIGVLLISIFSKNAHIGVELVLGNVDALHMQDLPGVFLMLLINLFIIQVFFKGLKLTTFDPTFAHMQGLSLPFYNYLIIFLLSITSIGAFRAIGVVLVLSFFVVPPLIARLYAKSIRSQIGLAVFFGVVASFLGVSINRHLLSVYGIPLSTGGVTVISLYSLYFLNWGFLYVKKLFEKVSAYKEMKLSDALNS